MNNHAISPWLRFCQIVAVSTMFAGYPLVAATAQLTGLPSTPLSIGMRTVTAAACVWIFLIAPSSSRSSLSQMILGPLAIFWIFFLIRMANDTFYYGHVLTFEPYSYWVWGVGGCFIPLLGISKMQFYDGIGEEIFRWTFYLTMAAAILTIPNIGTSLQLEGGELQETGRGLIQGLNPISLGHLGVQLLVMGVWYLFLRPDWRLSLSNVRYVIGMIVGTYLALVANSRGPLVAFVFVALFAFAASRLRSRYVLLGLLFLGAVAFVPIINLVDALSGTAIYARLFEQSQFEEVNTIARIELYNSAWSLFLDHPLLGAGLEDPTFGGYPHNVFIEAFMATGIFGGVAFAVGVLAAVYAAFQIMREAPLYAWIALIALQQLISAQLSGTLVQTTTMWGGIGLIISITSSLARQSHRERSYRQIPASLIQGR